MNSRNQNSFKNISAVHGVIFMAAVIGIFASAVFLRWPAFWAVHEEPVELAYVSLAMKMGLHPGLGDYYPEGVKIRRRDVPVSGSPGRTLPVASPFETDTPVSGPRFELWPPDSNPFFYKPPFFAALLAFSHHRSFGPKFDLYPTLASDLSTGRGPERSKAAMDIQFWAVIVPFASSLLVTAMTLILGWRCFGPFTGLLSAWFIAAHPAAVQASGQIRPEMTLMACLLAAVILFHYFVSIRSRAGCLLAGAALGLAVLTDHAAIFMLPAFWVWGSSRRSESTSANSYFWMTAAGAAVLCKSWFVDAGSRLGDFLLRPAADFAVKAAGNDLLPFAAVKLFESFPLLLAAIFSIAIFFVKNPSLRISEDEKYQACVVGSFIVSFIAVRWVYGPNATWNDRVFVPVLPFLSILAAWVLVRIASLIFDRKSVR